MTGWHLNSGRIMPHDEKALADLNLTRAGASQGKPIFRMIFGIFQGLGNMARAQPSLPMTRSASRIYREELRRKRLERNEIEAAMKAQALARDPAHAGIDIISIERHGAIIERDKRDGSIIRAEREGRNVFCQLGRQRQGQDEPTLNNEMVDAGNRMIELYAKKMGLSGRGERPERVDETPVHVGFIDDKMNRALKRWNRIVAEFGRFSRMANLLELLCQDAMETEALLYAGGRSSGKSRWRVIVMRATGERDPHGQATTVRQLCDELVVILKAVEGGVGVRE